MAESKNAQEFLNELKSMADKESGDLAAYFNRMRKKP